MSTRITARVLVALTLVGTAAGCSLPGRVAGPLKITAIFDDVGDLVTNHSVQVADVRVGSVTAIDLTEDFKAKITMELKSVDLPADSIAELRTTSLLGEKFIQLRPCDPAIDDPRHTGICTGASGSLQSGTEIPRERTREAPELEFVAREAVQLLGGVATNDLQAMIEAGAVGFGGRAGELRSILTDLSSLSATLANQAGNIGTIIDGLDKASGALAAGSSSIDQLLITLPKSVQLLADNRTQLIGTLTQLTRLAQDQNGLVFDPYLATVRRQVAQVDAILQKVAAGRQEVGLLLDFANRFVRIVPKAIPTQYAQVYGWFVACGATADCSG